MKSYAEAVALHGSDFQLADLHGVPLTLKLTEVQDKGSNDRFEQFTLLLKGPLNVPLSQGIYRLEHEVAGVVDWMLVPIARDVEGYTYEAVFNLMKN
ncbi:hypothetical protein ABE504_22165 [Paenibacillus oryzisoli]|uniref:DUF6916 family protein n=1 Tax=Paenibacillus oryzisoli TaxID=1850517 RepID=UPI003D2734F6